MCYQQCHERYFIATTLLQTKLRQNKHQQSIDNSRTLAPLNKNDKVNVKYVYRGIFVQQNTFNVVMFYKYAYRYAYKKILSCKNKQTTLTR